MRLLMILVGVAGLSHASLSAEISQMATLKKPMVAEQPRPPHSRCAKKIALGPDKSVVACLMQKHKGVTDHEAEHRASGSARDAPAQRRAAAPPSSR